MAKAIGILSAVTIAVLIGLWSVSYSTGAGTGNLYIGAFFVLLQAIWIIIFYTLWYFDVNRRAAELINIDEMRRAAFSRIPRYMFFSILVTAAVGGAAVAGVMCRVLFVDINQIFCLSAAFMELAAGNFTLLLLMCFWGLPDRVLGRY